MSQDGIKSFQELKDKAHQASEHGIILEIEGSPDTHLDLINSTPPIIMEDNPDGFAGILHPSVIHCPGGLQGIQSVDEHIDWIVANSIQKDK